MITLANAPVSYGVFELDAEDGVQLPGADELATMIATAGYAGIDSGPIGMLGRGQELRDRLRRNGLALAGGWVDLPLTDADAFMAALPGYRDAMEFFAEGAELHPDTPPRPTLADSGSDARRANPGGGAGLSLDDRGWDTLARNVGTAVEIAGEYGLRPTFHHHACTHVETPAEIDELLARTEIGLTFDTGHLIIGGGDPLEGLRRWQSRIDHLHIKDVRTAVLRDVVARKAGMRQVWTEGAFVPLGTGDLDVAGVMEQIIASGFHGWLVVEQDVIPQLGDDPGQPQAHQLHNRDALTPWFPKEGMA
ncbi:sugar phosphate isomerase/epimerase family protein [Ruania halotolerans]|uniref:sugar phosphate isomerase/epimerase family protein n=1 Tax=Ruania halotolerans TaxID=2897773 RepID=UPI001E3A66E2|nr:sugar phosphate isomerase/epimerase [Ruania halotolerans]UFU05235.1 sugar phosphate isomerase/epimerase [Ruania halotolerans]